MARKSYIVSLLYSLALGIFSAGWLAAAPSVRFSESSGTLVVVGSDGADSLELVESGGQVRVTVSLLGRTQSQSMPRAMFQKVVFVGEAGGDLFSNQTSIPSSVNGGAGNDVLRGGSAVDIIAGGDGDDEIHGGDGNDRLTGAEGDDLMFGDAGDDHLYGLEGSDTLSGGLGNDSVEGGDDDDVVSGDAGNDTVKGGDGNDELFGNDGMDRLLAGRGNDSLTGGDGDDELRGDDGDDVLSGGNGADFVHGGAGADLLNGDDGDDRLEGFSGDDVLFGGPGADRLRGGDGMDRLFGGAGGDQVYGQNGDDQVFGEDGDDYVSGDSGHDIVSGGAGNDFARGEDGNDVVNGDEGDDRVQGDDGNDVLLGGPGEDEVRGGRQRDLLVGGLDADELHGEWDDDILIGGVTAHDDDVAALLSIMLIWHDLSISYDDRIATLENSSLTARLFSGETVFDDGVTDELIGRSGQDWFFLPGGDGGSEVIASLDRLDDLASGDEQVNSDVPHPQDPILRAEHFALFELVRPEAADAVALRSGRWTDPSIWEANTVPSAGARVWIPEFVHILVDEVVQEPAFTIRVDGELKFASAVDSGLAFDTMIVTPSGGLLIGAEGHPVMPDVGVTLTISDSGPIDRDWDPFAFSRGIINHGECKIYGAPKTPWLPLTLPPSVGDSALELAEVPSNWSVGDLIVVAGSRPNESEEREILAIEGNLVTVAPLAFDHDVPQPGLQTHVGNLSRNVRVISANTDLARRGHVMFMHTRDVVVQNAGFYGLGRSDKKVVVDDVVVDENGQPVPGTGSNPRGRYSVHFHRNGIHRLSNPAVVQGSVVVGSPGWGFVNHSSYVRFADSVAYDVDGAAFATEVGDEIGEFIGNLAIHSVGSGESDESRNSVDDFGHGGDGYWFQGGGVSVVNNIATGQAEAGFVFFTRAIREPGLGRGRFLTESLRHHFDDDVVQDISQGHSTVDVRLVPIVDYHDNVAYACRVGSKSKWHQLTSTHWHMSHIRNLLLWGCGPITLSYEYSANIHFENLHLIGNVTDPGGKGANPNTFTRRIQFTDMVVEGFNIGIEVPQRQWSVFDGGFYNNLTNFDVQTAVEDGRNAFFTGDFQWGDLGLGKTQTAVQMRLRPRSEEHAFFQDQVTLDFSPFSQQRVYYEQQDPAYVLFPQGGGDIDPAWVGKTNQQLWDEFGIALGGELAPADAGPVEGIIGLVGP